MIFNLLNILKKSYDTQGFPIIFCLQIVTFAADINREYRWYVILLLRCMSLRPLLYAVPFGNINLDPWFNPHPSGCIGPHFDAILICFGLPPLLPPRWFSSLTMISPCWRTVLLQFACGRPGPLLNPGTSQCNTCRVGYALVVTSK